MTIVFAGGRINSLNCYGVYSEDSSSTRRDSSYVDVSVSVADLAAGSYLQQFFKDTSGVNVTVTSGNTVWLHFDCWPQHAGQTQPMAILLDAAGNQWLAVRGTSTAFQFGLYGNTGTAGSPIWTLLGTNFSLASALFTLDIKITLGSPHACEMYVNNSLVASGTFTQPSLANLAQFYLTSPRLSNISWFSQVLATVGESTVGAKVKYTSATGAGSNSGMTGAYTSINDAPNSDATIISSTAAGQKSTFAWGDVSLSGGFVLKSVFIWSRAKNDGSAPNNIKGVIRRGTTDYSTGNLLGMSTGFAPILHRADVDPSTGAAWTESGFNAAEFGLESAA